MKKIFCILGVFILCKSEMKSQTLSFTTERPANGDPPKTSTAFTFPQEGSPVYFVYNHTRSFKEDTLIYEIFRNGRFRERLIQKISPDWSYCWEKYLFYDDGEYEVKVSFPEGTHLTSQYVTITIPDSSRSETETAITTTYFAQSQIFLCDSVSSKGEPIHSAKEFMLTDEGKGIFILIKNPKPLGVDAIKLHVLKKTSSGENEIEEKKYDINGEMTYCYIKYFFKKAGTYGVKIETMGGIWINTAEVVIKK